MPVVIDQVGYWPRPNYNADVRRAARRTRDGQAKFCSEDLRAVLVQTDDLARFYHYHYNHYDAASFFISGNRIAHAYQEALEGVVECPDIVKLLSSSSSRSSSPSKSTGKSIEIEPLPLRLGWKQACPAHNRS